MSRLFTEIISLSDAIAMGLVNWDSANACKFYGVVPGFVMGFNVEMRNEDGKTNFFSCTFTNDYKEIRGYEYDDTEDYNELGLSASLGCYTGWYPTGRIIFRGYFRTHRDYDERDEYFTNASTSVIKIMAEKREKAIKNKIKEDSYIFRKHLTYNPFDGISLS